MKNKEGHKHTQRETEQKIIFHTSPPPSLALPLSLFPSLSFTCLFLFHIHIHIQIYTTLTLHQLVQSSQSSFESVSCKGPSLGNWLGFNILTACKKKKKQKTKPALLTSRLLLKRKPHHHYNTAPSGFIVPLQPLCNGRTGSSIKSVSGSN